MTTKTYQLQTLTCPTCVNKITTAVKTLPGVEEVEVLFNASKVKVGYNDAAEQFGDVKATIEKLGYEVIGER